MKKLFTLSVMALLLSVIGADAQNYRKWDFTNWSATTIDNLKAEDAAGGVSGAGWSSTEKANGDNPQPDNCYWSYSDGNSVNGALSANGAAISETEGLVFNPAYTAKRNLAIAINYPSALGDYAGPQYLWLGGGNAKSAAARMVCFTIPKVKVGQKIKFVVESHKPSDARGVSLYVGDATDDTKQIGESFKPTTQDTYTWENWTLPEGAATNDDGSVDVLVVNTNGCHIYSIEVGDDTQMSKIAYLYQGAPDATEAHVKSLSNYTVESFDVTATKKSAQELQAYDAIVIAANVTDAAVAAELKAALGWMPILNTSYALYETWALGTAVKVGEPIVRIKRQSSLFNGIEAITDPDSGISGIAIDGDVYGIKDLGSYFANDEIAGVDLEDSGVATAHIHNSGHNAYIYVPGGNEQLTLNAVKMVAGSKSAISAAPKPSIKFEFGNMRTKVVISSTVPSPKIYYTTDGSAPTTSSTVYSEPFWMDTESTIKACVEGDGYTLSDVAEAKVALRHQAATPVIAVEQQAGAAIVTLTNSDEASIFYNYEASNDSTKSTKYTGPIAIAKGRTLTAFAASQELVASELATQDITVTMPLTFTETLAHMDAAKDPFYQKQYDLQQAGEGSNTASNSKVAYFFSWGKTKTSYPYYDETAEPISTTVDPETGDEISVYPKSPEEKFDFGNGWAVRSRGQVICTEITIKPGKDVGNGSTYNPATVDEFEFAEEYPCTDFYVNISEWNTEKSPRSGIIYSTQKFKGPFAVLSYISNGNGGTGPSVVFETGTDIEGDSEETTWSVIGDTCALSQGQRLYKKFIRVYNGTDEVYLRTRIAEGGSKAGFYDIYVLGIDPSFLTGIEEVSQQGTALKQTAVYGIDGIRQDGLKSGLNIVVEDGVAKKVMKK